MMPLARNDAARVAEIASSLGTIDDRAPGAQFDQALDGLRDLLGVDQALGVVFERSEREVSIHRMHVAGTHLPIEQLQSLADSHFRRAHIWALYDPMKPEPAQRNRPVVVTSNVDDLAEGFRTAADPIRAASSQLGLTRSELDRRLTAYEETERILLTPMGWARKKQLRALVCDGASLLGWVGGMADEFSPREEALLRAVLPAVQRWLKHDAFLREAGLALAGLAAALDAIVAPAFLLSETGRIKQANAAGRAVIGEGDLKKRLAAAVRDGWPVPGLQLTPLAPAAGVRPHYLAVLRPPELQIDAKVAMAETRWRLTPRESAVLRQLAIGAANKQIAARFECSEKTIEVHVTRLLAKSGTASRLEVVVKVWSEC